MMYAFREEEEIAPTFSYPYWYGKPVRIRPWWLRSVNRSEKWKVNWDVTYGLYDHFLSTTRPGRGWFTKGFPVLGPYYPIPSVTLWNENGSESYYSSFWWP